MSDVYEYHGGVFHPRCLVEAMVRRGELSPAARAMPTGEALQQFAEANAVTAEDVGEDWLPHRVTVDPDDVEGDRECTGCDRPLTHDVSVPLERDPADRAIGERPSAREVANLLGDYRRMLDDAGGWASRIPRDRLDAWLARKQDLLARIEAHGLHHHGGDGGGRESGASRGWSR